MSTLDCFWHGPETDEPGDYGSCLECAHIWRTKADWDRDCVSLCVELGISPPTTRLTSCPLCGHALMRAAWDRSD